MFLVNLREQVCQHKNCHNSRIKCYQIISLFLPYMQNWTVQANICVLLKLHCKIIWQSSQECKRDTKPVQVNKGGHKLSFMECRMHQPYKNSFPSCSLLPFNAQYKIPCSIPAAFPLFYILRCWNGTAKYNIKCNEIVCKPALNQCFTAVLLPLSPSPFPPQHFRQQKPCPIF